MQKKIVIYTAIFGEYDSLIEQPKIKNVDYICYTDRTNFKSKTWKIVQVSPPIPFDNTRSNRYYKILAHKHLPENYDISVYIDGNILILKNFKQLIYSKIKVANMACFDHNQSETDIKRNCIYKEHEAIIKIGKVYNDFKDNPVIMKKQMDRFKLENYPKDNGLIIASILIRKHFNQNIINIMEEWWKVVLNESKRDQLSFNYIAWKLNFLDLSLIDGDIRKGNPWFYSLRHGKHSKLKLLKIKTKFYFSSRYQKLFRKRKKVLL